jgi:MOSC domain-containing protein YiiM
MAGTLVQLSISPGGMPKLPVPSAMVTGDGVAGDWQKNRKYHGGPDRAVCLYSVELYGWLREKGFDLQAGTLGENFTTQGFDLGALAVGDRVRVGEACVIEITDVREPCRQLKKWGAALPKLIVGRSGWVAKVVREGEVKAGDRVEVVRKGRDGADEEAA